MAAPGPERRQRLLILGGTAEGRALAAAAEARFGPALTVISALAGRTRAPVLPAGEVRIGGFGGAEGLAAYLRDERIGLLIDATHPFATQISAQACAAAAEAGTQRLALVRPPWHRVAGDRWIEVETVDDAAAAIPAGANRVFLTVGVRSLSPFAGRRDCWFLVRLVDEPAEAIPLARHRLICARGPFAEADERALLEATASTAWSRGRAAAMRPWRSSRRRGARAARGDGAPPAPPPGAQAASVDDALAWIAERLGEA